MLSLCPVVLLNSITSRRQVFFSFKFLVFSVLTVMPSADSDSFIFAVVSPPFVSFSRAALNFRCGVDTLTCS